MQYVPLDQAQESSLSAQMRQNQQKDRIAFILNTINEGVLVIDSHLHIRYYNRAAVDLFALPDSLERIKISQYLPSLQWQEILKRNVWKAVARCEVEIEYPQHRLLQFYLVPHSDDSSLATIILNDISTEKARHIEYIESERLRMVGLLAAGVAHEIGNPLNSISLHLQLLKRTIEKGSHNPEILLDILNTTQSEVLRLDEIIRDFLIAIRPGRPKLAPTQIQKVLHESLKVMLPEIQSHKIHLIHHIAEHTPEINIDAGQIKQIFINLIKNAIEATHEEGILDIKCEIDELSVNVIIKDTGCGIEPEEISKIFEPFHTTKSEGTGLGLMVVQRVIREHGAQLLLDSTPNVGTIFTLKFPIPGRRKTYILDASNIE